MSKLAQAHEDKVVKDLINSLEGYKKKLVNEFVTQDDIKSTISSDNTVNENGMSEACKKWGILRKGGFSGLRAYNRRVEDMKTLQKEYKESLERVVDEFEPQIRDFMESFDNYILNSVMDSGLFEEICTNVEIDSGKKMKI